MKCLSIKPIFASISKMSVNQLINALVCHQIILPFAVIQTLKCLSVASNHLQFGVTTYAFNAPCLA
jgi:hypothetical protein